MKPTTIQRFGSLGKSFTAPSAAAAVVGAALLASGTTDTADTAWSPAAACLLPDVLPIAGTLLYYGGSRQLAAGGAVTHSGDLSLGNNYLTAARLKLGSTSDNGMMKQGSATEAGNVAGIVVRDAADAGYMSLHAARLTASSGIIGCWDGSSWNGWTIFQNQLAATNVGRISWCDASSSLGGTENLKIVPSSAGCLDVRGNSGLRVRNFANSADAALTCGAITASGAIQSTSTDAPWYMGRFRGSNGGGIGLDGGGNPTILTANSLQTIGITGSAAKVFSPFVFGWIDATNVGQQLIDQTLNVALGFGGSGIVEINNGTTGTLRDLSCRAITASGGITVTGGGVSGTDGWKGGSYGSGYGAIWPASVTPGATNYSLLFNANGMSINCAGGTIVFETAAVGRWQVRYDGTFGAAADNTYDIGEAAARRPKNIYAAGQITAGGAIQETPTQSSIDPTTTDIPTGKRKGWYNSTLGEFRDWVNIGGTLFKSAAYT